MPTDIILVLIIVVVIVLLWRGPKVLPEWGAALGKTIREARSNASRDQEDATPRELSDGGIESTTAPRRDTTNAPRP
ncbi:MAG: hypothetical protein QOH61_1123 [Chloroflexota bacterium]|jgi:Sec-independent protein translocase protein TatA|nr:hypothetical protein [Chloroflexota bacterium]